MIAAGSPAFADDAAAAAVPEKSCTGMVKSVDSASRTVVVKKFLWSKRFNLGDTCVFSFVDKDARGIAGLRRGQKVTVAYQDVNGVLVADALTQQPLLYTGTVKKIDPEARSMTVGERKFELAVSCTVVLRNNKVGTLADVQPGHLVTVLLEKPGKAPVAYRISQTSESFTGSLTAIDLTDRTIKAKATFESKAFHLANNCAILLDGKAAEMKDLKPGDKLTFSFDDVDGVNVATRIVPADEPSGGSTMR